MSAATDRKIAIVLSLTSMVVSVIVLLFFTPFKLLHLGGSPEQADIQYGLNSFTESITSWFTLISSALSSSYIRFVMIKQKENGDEGVNQTNALYFLFFLVVIALASSLGLGIYFMIRYGIIPLDGYSAEQKRIITDLLLISLLTISVNLVFTVFNFFLGFKEKFVFYRTTLLLQTVLVPVVSIPFLLDGCDVQILAMVSLGVAFITNASNALFSVFVLKQRFYFRMPPGTKIFLRQIIVFSVFVLFNSIVDQIDTRIDKTILGFMAPPEYVDGPSQVTIYQLGQAFSMYLMTASTAISAVFIPKTNRLYLEKDKKQLNCLFLKVCRIQSCIVFFIVGGFWASGINFVNAWIGPERFGVYFVGASLLTLNAVPATETISIEVQRAANKHRFRGVLYLLFSFLNVAVSVLLVYLFDKQYAYLACVIGTAITTIPSKWIINNWYNRSKIGLPMKSYWIMILGFSVITALSVGGTFFISFLLPLSKNEWMLFVLKAIVFSAFEFVGLSLLNFKHIQAILRSFKKRFSEKKY